MKPRKAKKASAVPWTSDRQMELVKAYAENFSLLDDFRNNIEPENAEDNRKLRSITAALCQTFSCTVHDLHVQLDTVLATRWGKKIAEDLIKKQGEPSKDPEIMKPEQLAALADAITGSGALPDSQNAAMHDCEHTTLLWDPEACRVECTGCHRVYYNRLDLPRDRLGDLIHSTELGSAGVAELLAHIIAVLESSPIFDARDYILKQIYPGYLKVINFAPVRNPNQVEMFMVPSHANAHALTVARLAVQEVIATDKPEEPEAKPEAESTTTDDATKAESEAA